MRFLFALALSLAISATSRADFLIYEFSGMLPEGASQHSQIQDGENWTARFVIDLTVADINDGADIGFYVNNVVSGTFSFSGGFSQELVVDDWQTAIFNDTTFADVFVDVVSVRNFQGTNTFPLVQAYVASETSPVGLLDDDSLPDTAFSFTSTGNVAPPAYFLQLRFEDQISGEFVEYTTLDAVNVSFSTIAIPEPSTTLLGLTGLIALTGFRQRR